MKHVGTLLAKGTLLAILAFAAPSLALMPGDKVDNFKLLDHTGAMHELYYLSDQEAVVIMIHGNGCPIVRNGSHAFKALRDKYVENPANPDPNRTVPWGLQTWDEMLFGNLKFRYVQPREGDSSYGLAIPEEDLLPTSNVPN